MNKTISFELSKHLWEKGLRIETFWGWFYNPILEEWKCLPNDHKADRSAGWFPAPDTEELWGVLIDYYHLQKLLWVMFEMLIKEPSLPEALGLMVEWLLDEGYLKGEL